jgi:hypothetical protein
MAGVKWIRLDTTIFDNPKFLFLKEDRQYRTIVIHLEAMTFSGRTGLAGYVPAAALRGLGATRNDASRLVSAGLWEPVPGGWQIHGWDEHQLSEDDMQKRRSRAEKAAAARWAKRNGTDPNHDA